MKKSSVTRYDLDCVYWLGEYNKAVAYAEQNISINGVKAQLNCLKVEKLRYSHAVSTLVDGVRDEERQKYDPYKKWANIAKISKGVFLGALILFMPVLFVSDHIPYRMGNALAALWTLAFVVSTPVAIVTFLGRTWCARQYQQFVDIIDGQLSTLGRDFAALCSQHYDTIDNLFLKTLSPADAEQIRLSRAQIAQNQRIEETQKKLLREQQRTRAAQEETLAIERKREAEREAARRRW